MFHNTLRIGLVYVVLLAALVVTTIQAQNSPVKNVVLVHGAWADGSGWKGVYDILVKDGYNVTIVQEPETTFQEDVAATKRALALRDGPCILVAHSYGGAVITEAGTNLPKRVTHAVASAAPAASLSANPTPAKIIVHDKIRNPQRTLIHLT